MAEESPLKKEESPETLNDTVPNSPETEAAVLDRLPHGDFARLVPANPLAQVAFGQVAAMVNNDPETYKDIRQFMYFSQHLAEEYESTDTSGELPKTADIEWTGYYRLNIDHPPQDPKFGWVIGSGREDRKVDFVLSTAPRQHRVRGQHARFIHNRQTGVLMLVVEPRRIVWVNGKEKVEDSQRAMCLPSIGLAFGNLNYFLQYTGLNRERYREQLSNYLGEMTNGQFELPSSLETTPMENHTQFGSYVIQKSLGRGAFGFVSTGIDIRNGSAVAVKRITRTDKNKSKIVNEVAIVRELGFHPCICSLVAELYSGEDATSTGLSLLDEAYLVSAPLGRCDLAEVCLSDMAIDDRFLLARDCMLGLAHIHSHGIMHRDIKLANMMLLSHRPPHAMIIDFGCATRERQSKDHLQGTIAFLSPEMLALKSGKAETPYNQAVDVWAMGLALYQLLFMQKRWWSDKTGITEDEFVRLRKLISNHADQVLADFLRKLLEWDPLQRLSVGQAVQHRLWSAKNIDMQIYDSKRTLEDGDLEAEWDVRRLRSR